MLKQQQLYSKTPLAHKIVNEKRFNKIRKIDIDCFIGKINQSNLNVRKETIEDIPGTLGWGIYAFDLEENAKDFKGATGDVICYEVEYNDDNFLDLWQDEKCMRLLDDFTIDKSVVSGLKAYKKYQKGRNNRSIQRSDVGIIIELFIKAIKRSFNRNIDIVRMATKNNFNDNYHIDIYNSVEYCIKNNNIIKEETLKIS